jgi:hypothetical protein
MRDFYVSATSGSDVAGAGTLASPYATIEYAKAQAEAQGVIGDCAFNIAPGFYRPASILSHVPATSGSNGGKVRYICTARAGTANVLGSNRITGWTVHSGSIWKATIGTTPIHTLFENGIRARKARWPKYLFADLHPLAHTEFALSEPIAGSTAVQYQAGAFDPASWGSLTGLECVVASNANHIWFTDVVPVQSVDTGTRRFTFTREVRYDIGNVGLGSRFFIQNNLALLTQAGEFFHDTAAGVLYYWPRTVNPNLASVEAPARKRIFEVVGTSPTQRAGNIEVTGLRLAYTDFTNDYMFGWKNEGDSGEGHTYGAYDRLATRPAHRQAPVVLQHAENVSIRNCQIAGSGYYGVYGYGANSGHRIENFQIHRCGVGGIQIDGMYPGEGDYSRDNYIGNGYVGNVGELVGHGIGVALTNSGHNLVEYIEIGQVSGESYSVRSYSFGGGGYPTPPPSALYANGNVFRRSRMWKGGQDRGDMGAIYLFGLGAGNSNLAEDIEIDTQHASLDMYDIAPDGLFSDNDAVGQVYRNISMTNIHGLFARENSVPQTYENVQGVTAFNAALMAPDIGPARGGPF